MYEQNLTIRKANINDFDQIHKLVKQVHYLHIQERSDIYKDIDPIDKESYQEELSNNNNIYLVAEVTNKIKGICFGNIKNTLDNKIIQGRKILNIENICIDENNRKKGIRQKII